MSLTTVFWICNSLAKVHYIAVKDLKTKGKFLSLFCCLSPVYICVIHLYHHYVVLQQSLYCHLSLDLHTVSVPPPAVMWTSSAASCDCLHATALLPVSPAFAGMCPPPCLRVMFSDAVTYSAPADLFESSSLWGQCLSVGGQGVDQSHRVCRGWWRRRCWPHWPANQHQVIQLTFNVCLTNWTRQYCDHSCVAVCHRCLQTALWPTPRCPSLCLLAEPQTQRGSALAQSLPWGYGSKPLTFEFL